MQPTVEMLTKASFGYLPIHEQPSIELDLGLGRAARLPALEHEAAQRRERLMRGVVISLHDHPQVLPADMDKFFDYVRAGRQVTGYELLRRTGMTAVFDNLMGTVGVCSAAGWKWDDLVHELGMRRCDIAHQDGALVALSVADIEQAHREGGVAFVLGHESASPIENELDRIDVLYGLGIRQLGLVYNVQNMLGAGLLDTVDGGLSAFGRRVVRRMNAVGMAVDVSHASDRTALQAIEVSEVPIFITHAGARAVWDTPRMKPDEVLRELAGAGAGGVIGIEAAPHTTLSRDHPEHTLESVMDHFDYCVDLVGIDHVTFGPDTFFGDHVEMHRRLSGLLDHSRLSGGQQHPTVDYVAGLENPSEFGNIVAALIDRGYDDVAIEAAIGGNVMRVLRQVWR